jgi:hypothetical protein
MMDWQTGIALVGVFGLGGIFQSALTHWLGRKKDKAERVFEEKKEAYIGLIEALYAATIEPNGKSAKDYGHWHIRTQLVGSPGVIEFSETLRDSKPHSPERKNAMENLFQEMRNDLNIDIRKLK